MPAKLRNLGAFEERCPRRLEAGSGFKDTFSTVRLIAPTVEHTSGLLIQADVASLATLGSSAFDGQHLPLEVNAIPTQGQNLTASQSGIHGKNDRPRPVVAKAEQRRKQDFVALLLPFLS